MISVLNVSSLNNRRFLAIAFATLLTSACSEETPALDETPVSQAQPAQADTPVTTQPKKEAKFMELSGKIVYKTFEGGFYAIDGDDGKKYLPLNLPEHARKAGIKVDMQVEIKSGIMTIYNYGIPVEIKELVITDNTTNDDNVM